MDAVWPDVIILIVTVFISILAAAIAYGKSKGFTEATLKMINERLIEGSKRFGELDSKFVDSDGNERLVSLPTCGERQGACRERIIDKIDTIAKRQEELENKVEKNHTIVVGQSEMLREILRIAREGKK